MGLAVIAANTSIKVNGAVNATASGSGSGETDTIYTAPSSGYAIVQITTNRSGSGNIEYDISGSPLVKASKTNFAGQSSDGSLDPAVLTNVFIGPSQSLRVTWTGGSAGSVYVTGVEFINSP